MEYLLHGSAFAFETVGSRHTAALPHKHRHIDERPQCRKRRLESGPAVYAVLDDIGKHSIPRYNEVIEFNRVAFVGSVEIQVVRGKKRSDYPERHFGFRARHHILRD